MKVALSLCVLFFAISFAAPAPAQVPQNAPELVKEAAAFEKDLLDALQKGDKARIERASDPRLVFIHSTGFLEPGSDYIAHAVSHSLPIQHMKWTMSDDDWRVVGADTVINLSRITMTNPKTGGEAKARNLSVYVKTKGRGWQWMLEQSTKLPVRPNEIKVDAAKLAPLAGLYKAPDGTELRVTFENGVLFAVVTGRRKGELVPVGEDLFTFFDEENDPGFIQARFTIQDGGRPMQAAWIFNGRELWKAEKETGK